MSGVPIYRLEDYTDLPFDLTRHTEAFKSFSVLILAANSIRAALIARDLVFVQLPHCMFCFSIDDCLEVTKSMHDAEGFLSYQIIHHAESVDEANLVCSDVERYFLRHYPGRILKSPAIQNHSGIFVTITCYSA